MSRYADIGYVMEMEVQEGLRLYLTALKKHEKNKVWQMWLAKYPYMDKNNFISFDDFFAKATIRTSQRPKEEILADSRAIREAAKGR